MAKEQKRNKPRRDAKKQSSTPQKDVAENLKKFSEEAKAMKENLKTFLDNRPEDAKDAGDMGADINALEEEMKKCNLEDEVEEVKESHKSISSKEGTPVKDSTPAPPKENTETTPVEAVVTPPIQAATAKLDQACVAKSDQAAATPPAQTVVTPPVQPVVTPAVQAVVTPAVQVVAAPPAQATAATASSNVTAGVTREKTKNKHVENDDSKSASVSTAKAPAEESTAAQTSLKSIRVAFKKKSPEQVLRGLSHIEGTEAKLQALCEQYAELSAQHRDQIALTIKTEKHSQQTSKEMEQLRSDYNRSLLARDKLEGICRELQKQNNIIREENIIRRREEEEKRKKLSAKCQSTFQDITTLVRESQTKNAVLKAENDDLTQKMRKLLDHYDFWEQNVDAVMRHKNAETEILALQNRELQLEREQERVVWNDQRDTYQKTIATLKEQLAVLSSTDEALRQQISLYSEKYNEFQQTFVDNNETYKKFKKEMDAINKRAKRQEKELLAWKTRWEKQQSVMAQMVDEKGSLIAQVEQLKAANDRLTSLCRALQQQRAPASATTTPLTNGEATSQETHQQQPAVKTPPATINASGDCSTEDAQVVSPATSTT